MIILIEGADGSGKSTLLNRLSEIGFKTMTAPIPNRNMYEKWNKLVYNSIYYGENYIFDRSFISEIIYRVIDGRNSYISLGQVCELLKFSKIILCETPTQFEDSIARDETNITTIENAELIRHKYRDFIKMVNKLEKVPYIVYNWKVDSISKAIHFINNKRR
jgi:thymidylate kinase